VGETWKDAFASLWNGLLYGRGSLAVFAYTASPVARLEHWMVDLSLQTDNSLIANNSVRNSSDKAGRGRGEEICRDGQGV